MKSAYKCLHLMIVFTMFLGSISIGTKFYAFDVDLHPIMAYGQTLPSPGVTDRPHDRGAGITENLAKTSQSVPISPETSRITSQAEQLSTFMQNITYFDPINKFTIQFPSDWTPQLDGLADYRDRVTIYAPFQNLSDLFPPQITISMTIYDQNISLSEYTNQYITNLNQTSGNQVIGTNRHVLDGYPANIIVYSSFSPFIGNGTRFDNMVAWTVVDGNKVFLITYSAEATKYRTFLYDAIPVMNSFRTL